MEMTKKTTSIEANAESYILLTGATLSISSNPGTESSANIDTFFTDEMEQIFTEHEDPEEAGLMLEEIAYLMMENLDELYEGIRIALSEDIEARNDYNWSDGLSGSLQFYLASNDEITVETSWEGLDEILDRGYDSDENLIKIDFLFNFLQSYSISNTATHIYTSIIKCLKNERN